MASGGPYKPGRPSQHQLEQIYAEQAKHINMNSYQLDPFIVLPDVYIMGQRYSGSTGKLIK